MSRQERSFGLLPNDWELFDNIQNALGHDSPEETLKVLVELGFKAVGVTDRANREVNLMGGPKLQRKDFCKKCGEERLIDIYPKQMALRLGVDEKSLAQERETEQAKQDAPKQLERLQDSQSGD